MTRWSVQCLLAVAAVLAFALLTALHVGNSQGWTAFGDLSEVLAAILATAACIVRVRRERTSRPPASSQGRPTWIAWAFVAGGVGAWALGQIGWSVYEVVLVTPAPTGASFLDIFFLAFPVLVVTGLLTMVQTPAGRLSQLRGVAEGLLIAAGFFLLSWSLIIGSVLDKTHAAALGEAVNLAFPVLDAVALAAVLFVALRRDGRSHSGLALLGLGIVCVALADSAFWYITALNPSFPGASPSGTGWVAGFLLIALAAVKPDAARHRWQKLSAGRVVLIAPALPAAAGMLTALTRWLTGADLGSVVALLGIVAAVAVLAIVLQVIVTYENRALTADLEHRVQERTAALHTTERYYRALVEHSSDVVMIVDGALRVRYVNDSVLDIFGYQPAELVGHDLEVFGAAARTTLADALERTAPATGQISRVRWTLVDASGRACVAESTITNLLGDRDVEAFVLNTRDETDRVALEEQLRDQAFHDPLTGLSNRALLSDRATHAFARSLRTGASVAAIIVDLDGFKLVNDSVGHQGGDMLLHQVARRLSCVVRPEDTLARIGGDEFVVLVDAVGDAQEATLLAERLRGAIAERFELSGEIFAVTASVGVAVGSAAEMSFEELLRDADTAMYSVKAGGKNAVRLFEASMQQRAHERLGLQADLADALERGEMWLLYQPVFDLADQRLEGFEALVRWNHPRRGLVPPDQFIPLAEQCGLIVPLGRLVLLEALGQAVKWDPRGDGTPVNISVNVSAVQLQAPSLLTDVREALERSGISPARVVLEITESSLVAEPRMVIDTLTKLKQLGVRIAIDDFGTGYASLSYLQSMPVDILKVDQAFVRASDDDGRGRDLLEAIVSIGRSLSLLTVAEGVEEPEQLDAVRRMGCDLAQGYLLGRPLPIEEARHVIAEDCALAARS